MSKYNCGLKTLKVGAFNTVTGAITALTEVQVYKNTFSMVDPEPQRIKHYQEGKRNPRKVVVITMEPDIKFSIMDSSAQSIFDNTGGSVTTVDTVKKWHAPAEQQGEVIKALVIETVDGTVITVPRGSWSSMKNFSGNEDGIFLLDITVSPTETGVEDVDSMTIADAADDEEG